MTAPIYKWKDSYYCDGDVVGALAEDLPWSGWVELGNDIDERNTEGTLTEMARFFNINRDDVHQCEAEKFPILITETPEPPVFCGVCLQWFS